MKSIASTRWQKRQRNESHKWHVGELCTCVYGEVGEGLIYRVIEVMPSNQLKVKPVFGVIADTAHRKVRNIGAGWCTPLSLVELATEYTRFGLFIAQEAKRRGAEPETDAEEVPAGDDRDDQGRSDHDDGGGLCADVSARGEVR